MFVEPALRLHRAIACLSSLSRRSILVMRCLYLLFVVVVSPSLPGISVSGLFENELVLFCSLEIDLEVLFVLLDR